MSGGALSGLSKWLAAGWLSSQLQTNAWIIPTLQTIHILVVAVLFSSVILVDLRVLGVLQRDAAPGEVAKRFLPVVWPALLVLLASGSLLIVGEPRRTLLNPTFYLKMALLLAAIALTVGLRRAIASGSGSEEAGRRFAPRLAAALSMLAWCGIVIAGRWIAYTGDS
jgi:hypothetical protein